MTTQPVSNELLLSNIMEIKADVKELKVTKIDVTMHEKDMKILDMKIEPIRQDVASIKGYVKWVAYTIIGGVLIAVLNLVVNSPTN